MSKAKIPTFRAGGELLTGPDAVTAWESQSARCNCGSHGDKANAVAGSWRDMPAKWLGCTNCTGQAVGQPLVFRLPSQFAT